jgi:hypothetical protein
MGLFSGQRRMNNRLMRALSDGDAEKAEKALKAGAALEQAGGNYANWSRGPLQKAVEYRFAEGARLLLARKADPEARHDGYPCLAMAVLLKDAEMAAVLLEHGANVEGRTDKSNTPLQLAAKEGQADLVRLLLDHGAKADAKDPSGNTALHLAAAGGHGEAARLLIGRGADNQAQNANLNSPADVAEVKYPGLAAIIRRGTAPEPEEPPVAAGEWRLVGKDEIARVAVKPAINYRITEIFNFSARTYAHIATNLASGAESQSLQAFSALDDDGPIQRAHEEFIRRGGATAYEPPVRKLAAAKQPAPGRGA